jgi:hypothetical protein
MDKEPQCDSLALFVGARDLMHNQGHLGGDAHWKGIETARSSRTSSSCVSRVLVLMRSTLLSCTPWTVIVTFSDAAILRFTIRHHTVRWVDGSQSLERPRVPSHKPKPANRPLFALVAPGRPGLCFLSRKASLGSSSQNATFSVSKKRLKSAPI